MIYDNKKENLNRRALCVLEAGQQRLYDLPANTVFATIEQEIKFDQNIFDSYCYDGWGNVHHDLLVVCAAIEFADRRWARPARRWSRHIHIVLPVLEVAIWQDAQVQQHLLSTLRHLTGDEWSFSFVQWKGAATKNGRQHPLFPNQEKSFAIAYSDGLDSRCVAGLLNKNDVAVCVRVSKHKAPRRKKEPPFDRLPFEVKVKPSQEDSVRSRGFKFAAITAIAAHLSGVSRIVVPESGQGALGPVLLPLRGIYPDYRNHPTFFRRMEKFIHVLLGINIAYEQPRLWNTKGETIAAFLGEPEIKVSTVLETRSCWQTRHNVRVGRRLKQCGICAACLLRRMSLHAADVDDPIDGYSVADLTSSTFSGAYACHPGFEPTKTLYEFGYMGARHLQQLSEMASYRGDALKSYTHELASALGATVDDTQSRLKNILVRHSAEWRAFEACAGEESFLRMWTMGGRHG